MSTKQEIQQRVAEELALVPVGQAAESQDQNRINEAFDQMYERLKTKGLATWASTAEVPAEIVPYFELMMLEKLLTRYSVPEGRYIRIKTDAGPDGNAAMANISELVTEEYESTNDQEDF